MFAVLLAAACGDNKSAGEPSAPPLSPAATSTAEATRPAASATPADETPTPSPTSEPAPASGEVIDAAVAVVGGLHVTPLTLDGCLADNPQSLPCIDLDSSAGSLDRGLAAFSGGYPDGGTFDLIMGRMADGSWGYWFSSQDFTYVLDELPGTLIACGGGADVTVVSEPGGSESVGVVFELDPMDADEFVLLEAGVFGAGGERGVGYYHITAPVDGWVDARMTSDASLNDCTLRDAVEAQPRG